MSSSSVNVAGAGKCFVCFVCDFALYSFTSLSLLFLLTLALLQPRQATNRTQMFATDQTDVLWCWTPDRMFDYFRRIRVRVSVQTQTRTRVRLQIRVTLKRHLTQPCQKVVLL